ncbi:hypothetical protein FOA52_014719 [Chlamydomonas sp. UWO 241]|nr:hypothetical protein FOA52_014719 [Chlamydomonas sp. UWO 241]
MCLYLAVALSLTSQVVIIAAGYDTRAYRLCQPGVTFFEVDLPVASERKKKLVEKCALAPAKGRLPVYAAADLSRVDLSVALEGTGFDPKLPTLFTIEGLIYYLPEAAAHRLVASVGRLAAPGSQLVFDFMHRAALTGHGKGYPGWMVTAKAVATKGEPYLFGIESAPAAVQQFVGLHGFRLQEFLSPRDMMEKHLPRVPWSDRTPPIASFYSYASVVKQ